MKKRTFYVINLDRNRILMLAVVMVGFVLIAFATGMRYGRAGTPSVSHLQDEPPLKTTGNAAGGQLENGSATAPAADRLDIGRSPREIGVPRSPDEVDGLVDNSLRAGQPPAAKPETSDRPDSSETKRSSRRQKTKASASSRKKRERSHRRKTTEKKQRRADASHPPRTAMRNTALVQNPSSDLRKSVRADLSGASKRQAAASSGSEKREPSYSLQLGTYRYPGGAMRLSARLRKQGFPARVIRQGKTHKVLVGKTSDRAALRDLRRKLKKERFAPITVRSATN